MSDPASPQAVLGSLTEAAIFLVATVDHGGEDTVRDLLADLAGLTRAVGFRAADGDLTCVAGVGAEVWPRLVGGPLPSGLHPFREIGGATHTAVATPGDLLLHIRARRMDLCFELASLVTARLAGAVTVVDEVHGFRYFEQRDLLGFVDGTENPTGAAAAAAVLTHEPGFDGGSYVIVQKYVHDMDAWNALPTEEQERVIGRRKLSDVELSEAEQPANSHVALTSIAADDGEELEILRDNMPFGRPGSGEFGTYFIGYAADPAVTELMLEHMFVGDPPGNHDRILDFSVAVTGTLFFAPSADFLEALADPPPTGDGRSTGSPTIGSSNVGSLTIGSLKRSNAS
ncbi:Dyp-type peroxidase [Jiangella ureilytica]|uniref:Dyp-type peroxidase n=1 Tax=Jiangella ureilytica TaxID=2530374 RepID=A0A4R4RLX7_9ACTN|nr:Dyp-type peroxidase [Jiangella ureilytica]TDC50731.1 Dyp-type peroxidase [Jiangella ureilytica]